jgi:hypothetical protein
MQSSLSSTSRRERKTDFTLYNSDKCFTVSFANNQINLPIANSAFLINNLGTIINTYTVLNIPSTSLFLLTARLISLSSSAQVLE